MSCNNNCGNFVDNCECGCSHQHSAACIFYKGDNLSCINVPYNTDLETALASIDEAICNLNPSGHVYEVNSCNRNITVTPSVSEDGGKTTYTVCLSNSLVTQINTNTTNISSIQSCLNNAITSLYSDTLSVGIKSEDECGTTWQIELANPSGTPTYTGIVNNDTTAATLPNGGGGAQIVKTFTWDYISNNNISDKDEIYFTARGKVKGNGEQVDSIKLSIYDVNSSTEVFVIDPPYSSFSTSGISSYEINGTISVIDRAAGTALVSVNMKGNGVDNGVNSGSRYTELEVCSDVSGIDFSNLRIRVIQVNDSGYAASNDNSCRQLKVGVDKYIG